jgi:hypothetical protein
MKFYYLYEFGLFCDITLDEKRTIKIADDTLSFDRQRKMMRAFLTDKIHLLLKSAKKVDDKKKKSMAGVNEEIKIAKEIQKMKKKMDLKDIATTLNKSITYVHTRTREDYIPNLLEKQSGGN